MSRRSRLATAVSGEGGGLARRDSTLGVRQRVALLQAKQTDPTVSPAELAGRVGCSEHAVLQFLASATLDMQPVLRSYAEDAAEAYLSAVQIAAMNGKHEAARDLLIDGGAIPDRAKTGAGLNVTVVVSAPPGTPQYVAIQAPEPLTLEAQAGPSAPLTPLLPETTP